MVLKPHVTARVLFLQRWVGSGDFWGRMHLGINYVELSWPEGLDTNPPCCSCNAGGQGGCGSFHDTSVVLLLSWISAVRQAAPLYLTLNVPGAEMPSVLLQFVAGAAIRPHSAAPHFAFIWGPK